MEIDSSCNVMTHLKSINPKINFLTHKFGILRHKQNLKLNINLFEIFLKPLFKLGFALAELGDQKHKEQYLKHYRIKWKIFIGIPITTANRVVNKMMGNLQ